MSWRPFFYFFTRPIFWSLCQLYSMHRYTHTYMHTQKKTGNANFITILGEMNPVINESPLKCFANPNSGWHYTPASWNIDYFYGPVQMQTDPCLGRYVCRLAFTVSKFRSPQRKQRGTSGYTRGACMFQVNFQVCNTNRKRVVKLCGSETIAPNSCTRTWTRWCSIPTNLRFIHVYVCQHVGLSDRGGMSAG